MVKRYKSIITYGTFDLFHVGHVRLLRRLSAMAETVIVGCSTDEFNAIKGKKCVMPYTERAEILEACRYVDVVFPENNWEQKPHDVQHFGAQAFAMGDDWAGKFDALKEHCEVIYLGRTDGVSTTNLKITAVGTVQVAAETDKKRF
ncbi:Glycerol-3-phosphate cytidylyltransferase [Yoonia tamlensis]|uniref:Glycerol-3-phosphate cytidylyltransferase n=1 Tax=Yoonia tamlensis TaxID=390270 RepID=A0A1I6I3Z7_9RHOB|nr:adenylyltransferase/cytidyltransferase family protein [Yoonia tamlensis]SFR61368.1 Glycerol-3-phosphate cytidylyltransferase [Yoonia tamlensis]